MFDPLVLGLTVRLPVCGGGAAQPTENAVDTVLPACTLTVRDVPPLTVQFAATPDSATVWFPAERSVNVTLPLVPIAWLAPPATVTVQPSAATFDPLVLVLTVRVPVR